MTFHLRLGAVTVVALFLCAPVFAQQTAYKWVDKNGNVHFSDEPPPTADAVSVEEIVLPESSVPRQSVPLQRSVETSAPRQEREKKAATPSNAVAPSADVDFGKLSQEDLDRRCEAEREAKIAPLRDAEIQKCIHEQEKDPDYCRRFFSDLGEGGRTVHGTYRPRMFNDLPVCVEAEKRRHGR
jgi:hypothetical protein